MCMRTPMLTIEDGRGNKRCVTLEDYFYNHQAIWIEGRITPEMCDSIMGLVKILEAQLMTKERDKDSIDLRLYINSPGGALTSGLNLYDFLKNSNLRIKTVVTGQANSMAGLLFLAGDERCMMPYSRLMIHEPAKSNVPEDSMEDMIHIADDLRYYKEVVCEIIADRTNLSKDEVFELITNRKQYYNAEEALKYGFATNKIVHSL